MFKTSPAVLNLSPNLSRCVGLWLAEGDNKTKSEITFTNSCADLVDFFAETIIQEFAFKGNPRIYCYSHENLMKLKKIGIADLHPLKKIAFERMVETYKEIHYPAHFLKNRILKDLKVPHTSQQLSKKSDRSIARIQDIVIQLKKDGKIKDFRVESTNYWIRSDQNMIIISNTKKKYLDLLGAEALSIKKISSHFEVRLRSSYKILKRLEQLRLIKKDNHKWRKVHTNKKVIVL